MPEIIDNQTDFENAFLSNGANDSIKLAAGYYELPIPEDKNKIYIFNGSIVGCGEDPAKVVLRGKFSTDDHLTLKNLTLDNDVYPDGLIAFQNSQLNLQDVNLIHEGSDNCHPLRCDNGAKVIGDNVLVNYDSWGQFTCQGPVQLVLSNCRLQGLDLQGDGGNATLNEVSIGEFLIKGDWNVTANKVSLYDHPQSDHYIRFTTSKDERLKGRKWLFYDLGGTVVARDLSLPDELSPQVSPVAVDGGQLVGNVAASDKRDYQPRVDTRNAQVQLKEAANVPLLRDNTPRSHTAVKELDQLIGLTTVKRQVNAFIQMALMNKRRQEAGMSTISNSFHSLFEGNPGTGKTTVARIVGKLMYEEGILPTSNYVEVDRGDLVAGYVGQTNPKTTKILEKATGGVLFIDEAYDLVHGPDDSFGLEALDTIMKYMEDHRDNLMIIFAGYTADMEELLKQNSGMKSRVPNVFTFDDYSPEEIAEIGRLQLRGKQMRFDQPNTEKLYNQLIQERYANSNDHSNGRWIRNQNDLLLRQIAMAMSQDPDHPLDEINAEDITNAFSGGDGGGHSQGTGDNHWPSRNAQQNTSPMPPINNHPLPFLNGDELK